MIVGRRHGLEPRADVRGFDATELPSSRIIHARYPQLILRRKGERSQFRRHRPQFWTQLAPRRRAIVHQPPHGSVRGSGRRHRDVDMTVAVDHDSRLNFRNTHRDDYGGLAECVFDETISRDRQDARAVDSRLDGRHPDERTTIRNSDAEYSFRW